MYICIYLSVYYQALKARVENLETTGFPTSTRSRLAGAIDAGVDVENLEVQVELIKTAMVEKADNDYVSENRDLIMMMQA